MIYIQSVVKSLDSNERVSGIIEMRRAGGEGDEALIRRLLGGSMFVNEKASS
jgi:hypothetical protein